MTLRHSLDQNHEQAIQHQYPKDELQQHDKRYGAKVDLELMTIILVLELDSILTQVIFGIHDTISNLREHIISLLKHSN
ncbi:hypothetical protein LPH50_04545 [Xylella taiwanensis]|nr:hypothetical protein [Xylella taiwanensis]MCD8457497.1 hypothetical protein [Xylella taiwanensis]MCD8457656.1 hypothetical protein [Xylella taiwanensis]MCD8461219.1 hypothetical protein [Xylella taiwanensis]MCD8462745.1 hypothetical protein [Xylella taiwanensis]MCD8466532.1 hypothetical protein [Xylella taiwanensis]